MQTDTSLPLRDIRDRYQARLVPQLLEIQKHQSAQEKSLDWQCLRWAKSSRKRRRGAGGLRMLDSAKILRLTQISNDPSEGNYIAVSYPWEPSSYEDPAVGGYEIESADGKNHYPSEVRDVVWDRVTAYAEQRGVNLIWIDRQCINQEDPDKKETAMQSMDLVYSFSRYPLGLIFVPIESQEHLDLLLKLFRGDLVDSSDDLQSPVLNQGIYPETASRVLELLDRITSDQWWYRAWIFQEDYRSSVRMHLLIPHSPSVRKDHAWEFGSIHGELQVNSARFREESTLFCLAYLQEVGKRRQGAGSICERILEKAGKYNILHQARDGRICKAMSSSIFADVRSRKIKTDSDLLAIVANCCGYSIRLNTKSLGAADCSLSLCILALYLLNGEIIRNDKSDRELLSSSIFKYLKEQSMDNFDPPVECKELTFIKHCRFVDVELSQDGITTTGWLWRLYGVIETTTAAFGKLFLDTKSCYRHGLKMWQRRCLMQLASELRSRRYETLADDLDDYLSEDAFRNGRDGGPSKQYMDLMASEVAQAIKEGNSLQLGCLLGDGGSHSAYRGIFIRRSQHPRLSHVFTAWSPGGRPDNEFGERNIEKHVSLEVDMVGEDYGPLPLLETKRWINGLCFFSGTPPMKVVFPWPVSLRGQG